MLEQPGFGKRLRQLRQERGISQVALAGTGMSAAYLSRLESGGRRPTARAVSYLAEQLGIPVEMFEDDRPEDSLTEVVALMAAVPESDFDAGTGKLLAESLAAAGDADDLTRWHALAQLARVYEVLGDFRKERETLLELNALGEKLGRAALQSRARIRLARCERDLGNVKAARDAVTQALGFSDERRVRVSASDSVRARLLLASCQAELGDLAEAARLVDEVCESLRGSTGPLAAQAFWSAATVAARQGNDARAAEYLTQAMVAIDSRDDLTLWMRLRLAGASLSLASDPPRVSDAEEYLAAAEPAMKLIGSPRHLQELRFLQAKLAFHQDLPDRTAELLAAGEGDKNLLSYRDQVRYDVLRNLVALRSGDRHALDHLRDIAGQVQACNMPDLAAEVWRTVAQNAI
ncbi:MULTISPECIES: helix-turn-helix domain-containing protein [unclassified Streptomyces]|uniref:helix-turn-helix domain-containing protein n=1 Tax=unclassified Streptomyces TaxID=2593676 RepID=UPI00109EB413|nr:helix-turn-helix transcriptional regulator [Streptomyces sp. A1136]THA51704.1 helix-turn-helix domain-containing protein [Streptomyces sp. A1136]